MSSNVIRFEPKETLNAKQNLERFIDDCRTHLTVFGKDTWDKNKWHVYNDTTKVGARFSTNLKPHNSYHFEPLAAPFLDFAKAYIKNIYTDNPVKNLQRHFEAIRVLEEALILATGEADILKLDGTVLERLDEAFRRQLANHTARNKAGYQMELILNFCRASFITPSLPEWSNPYGKDKDLTIAVDENGKEHRAERMPTEEEMMLVADLFSKAPEFGIETEYYTAIFALLMTAPSRGSEETVLPVDCLVWEKNSAGIEKLGIKWMPAKKGKAGLKWVPTAMEDVVIQAVDRLKKIGEPAREVAQYAETYPEKFMIHEGCITQEEFSDETPLSLEQFNAAMSLNCDNLETTDTKWIQKLLSENEGSITYQALGQYEYTKYVKKFPKWPYADKGKHVKVADALLLHRINEFHADFNPRGYSFSIPTVNQINDRFNQGSARSKQSLWTKHGIKLASGEPIELTTHCARHWLSTLGEKGGIDELTLANWAGRAKVRDNRSYDHRTEDEKSGEVAAIMIPKDANALEKIKNRIPVSFQDIGKDLDGAAIVTELGICEHDYAMSPCHRNGDCETCKELVCIKGFSDSLDLLKKREEEVQQQLEKATQDYEMGAFGADRWVSNHGWRLSHIRTKIRILEDENTPEGAAIRIPEEYDPSPAKEVLRNKGLETEIESPDELDYSDDIFELMES